MTERERIRNIELKLLTKAHCDSKVVEALRTNLFRLSNVGFRKFQSDSNMPDASQAIACLADAIHYDENDDTPIERIHEYITSIKQIGDTSVFGEVYSASLLDQQGAFVYKIAKRGDLTHETTVGFLALNPLRKVTPHFMQTYTSFFCSPPVGNSSEAWCTHSGQQVRYLVVENIVNGISLRKFIETASPERVFLVLLMIYNALLVAQRTCKFIHNDLHYENVMVQTHSTPQVVPYYNESKKPLWLSTFDVPKIIDFGYAAFMHDGEWLHAFNYQYKNPNYLFDFYKLLCFAGEAAFIARRFDTMQMLQTMFDYFHEGSLVNRIKQRSNDRNDYYEIRGHTNDTPVNFVRYLEKQFMPIIRSKISYDSKRTMQSETIAHFASLIMTNSQLNRLSDYMYLYQKLPSMSSSMQYIAKQKLSTFSLSKFLKSDLGYSYFDKQMKSLYSYDPTKFNIDIVRKFVENWFTLQVLGERLTLIRDALELHPEVEIDTFELYKDNFNALLANYEEYIVAIEERLRVAPSRELKALYSTLVN